MRVKKELLDLMDILNRLKAALALNWVVVTQRIFGTRANELSKIPYFRGFTTCIHGLEVML